ncbi:MAG: multidrug/spermidine efflux SMR transporter subunit MdtI [Burkholderiales bacterium]|jgi:spermidine export protein MdtI|nr:multidrug/spermidine efflux SMR transporter subunit MdtI [Burkholderiales bacterium]
MFSTVTWVHVAWLAAAIGFELAAQVLIKLSDGFRRRAVGVGGLLLIAAAFACLGRATTAIPLTVAYAIWGGTGLAIAVLAGRVLFGQRLPASAWAGLVLVAVGITLFRFV